MTSTVTSPRTPVGTSPGIAQDDRPVIEFRDVVQSYGGRTPFSRSAGPVLDHVDLRIQQGIILCLLGPSGAGKTTMVDLVMGNTIPRSGSVTVLGEHAPYPKMRSQIGYMPQDEALYNDITAVENLRFFGAMQGMRGSALKTRIEQMLDFARLQNHRDKLVSTFSGGMKRRLSLAVALLHDPRILVLDEPTVGLDPDHRLRIWKSFETMARNGTTLLVTTHVMDEASRCDQIAMLYGGRIIASASPGEILAQTGTGDLEHAFLALSNDGVDATAGAHSSGDSSESTSKETA